MRATAGGAAGSDPGAGGAADSFNRPCPDGEGDESPRQDPRGVVKLVPSKKDTVEIIGVNSTGQRNQRVVRGSIEWGVSKKRAMAARADE